MSGSKWRIRPLLIHFLLDHHHNISPPLCCCCRPALSCWRCLWSDYYCVVRLALLLGERSCQRNPSIFGQMRLDTTRGWLLPGSVYRAQSLILSVLVQQRRRIGLFLVLSDSWLTFSPTSYSPYAYPRRNRRTVPRSPPKKINANEEEEITGRAGEVFTVRAQSFFCLRHLQQVQQLASVKWEKVSEAKQLRGRTFSSPTRGYFV